MSVQYDEYLKEHKDAVYKGFLWMKENIPEIFENNDIMNKVEYNIKFSHDTSKELPDEYEAYDNYFYGKNRSAQIVDDFNYAWLKHIQRNPHHWQHWILHKDDPNEQTECLEMPYENIVEMICDWWSFSWNKGDLFEIFNWYNERKNHIMLNNVTRNKLESILLAMQNKLLDININVDVNANTPGAGVASAVIEPKINLNINDILEDSIRKTIQSGFMNNTAQ